MRAGRVGDAVGRTVSAAKGIRQGALSNSAGSAAPWAARAAKRSQSADGLVGDEGIRAGAAASASEKAVEHGRDLGCEAGGFDAAQGGEAGVGGLDVAGMVYR